MTHKPFYLAVRGILKDNTGKFLLLKRAKTSRHQPNFWEFPGGKVDPGEDFASALIREFQEETGLNIHLESIAGSGQWEREDYRIAYLFAYVSTHSGSLTISREHDDAQWMSADELKTADISPQLKPLRDMLVAQALSVTDLSVDSHMV